MLTWVAFLADVIPIRTATPDKQCILGIFRAGHIWLKSQHLRQIQSSKLGCILLELWQQNSIILIPAKSSWRGLLALSVFAFFPHHIFCSHVLRKHLWSDDSWLSHEALSAAARTYCFTPKRGENYRLFQSVKLIPANTTVCTQTVVILYSRCSVKFVFYLNMRPPQTSSKVYFLCIIPRWHRHHLLLSPRLITTTT